MFRRYVPSAPPFFKRSEQLEILIEGRDVRRAGKLQTLREYPLERGATHDAGTFLQIEPGELRVRLCV